MTEQELIEFMRKAAAMVEYDPDSGSMLWRAKEASTPQALNWNARFAGKECGSIGNEGYRQLSLKFDLPSPRMVLAHRLAWFIAYGELPKGFIDHINQCKSDNRLVNLRDVPQSINQRNGTRNRRNTSGVTGVSWHKKLRKWLAQATVDGRNRYVGVFNDIEKADEAVRKFRAQHGFLETHGRLTP